MDLDSDTSLTTSFSVIDASTIMHNMRKQDESQFYTLVKMHLSFILNFTSDQVDAPALPAEKDSESGRKILPFSVKGKVRPQQSKGSESVVLSHEGVCQAFQLIEFLNREENLTQEGLFRKTGNLVRQQELKQYLMSGSSIDFDSGLYSAHDCASVLKGFLASLSEPLLTKALYPAHCQVADLCPVDTPSEQLNGAHNKQIKALQLLFLLVPAENYQLLKDLLFLLYRVSKRHSENKMNALNLGTMFAPHILCPRKMSAAELQNASGSMAQAVALMIENTPLLFRVPQELEIDMRAFLSREASTPSAQRGRRRRHSASDADSSPQADTVFTFVDRQRSAAAGERDDTETALAGLYAHISSMPDSARRRKLIKQFNRESGAGTPSVARRARTRSFGESLRKHLFFSKQRKPPAKGGAPRRSSSEEALSSPASPDARRRYRQPAEEPAVSMCPTPSQVPALKQPLLTPTAAGRFTPRLAQSLRQVQRESVPRGRPPPPGLPGSARRSDRAAEMTTFRAGRNNSMRRGQVPLRPVHDGPPPAPTGPASPISQKMDTMCSSTRVQMLTPRNRRAVCLLSQSNLPAATQAAPETPSQAASPSPVEVIKMAPLSPVPLQPLDDSPSGPKRARRQEAGLSSPFCRYLRGRDMLTAEPVDLSLVQEVASTPPTPADCAVSPERLLAGEATLSDSLMDCLDGANPGHLSEQAITWRGAAEGEEATGAGNKRDGTGGELQQQSGHGCDELTDGASSAEHHASRDAAGFPSQTSDALDDAPGTAGEASASPDEAPVDEVSAAMDKVSAAMDETSAAIDETSAAMDETSASREEASASVDEASSRLDEPSARLDEVSGDETSRWLTSVGSGTVGGVRPTLGDISNRLGPADMSPARGAGMDAVWEEDWGDSSRLPAEPSVDDTENQRRKTLTDRDTNPLAHRKIGAPRKRRSVLFETDL